MWNQQTIQRIQLTFISLCETYHQLRSESERCAANELLAHVIRNAANATMLAFAVNASVSSPQIMTKPLIAVAIDSLDYFVAHGVTSIASTDIEYSTTPERSSDTMTDVALGTRPFESPADALARMQRSAALMSATRTTTEEDARVVAIAQWASSLLQGLIDCIPPPVLSSSSDVLGLSLLLVGAALASLLCEFARGNHAAVQEIATWLGRNYPYMSSRARATLCENLSP